MADQQHYSLGAALDIAHAAAVKTDLQALLEGDSPILLQAAAVERVDAAGLQLISSFLAHCQSHQRDCQWDQPSAALCEAAAGLGLAQALQLQSTTDISTDSGVS